MDDVKSEEDISTLAVMELKQILTANFIEYKGCCEKRELIEKVKMLYQSEQKIKQGMGEIVRYLSDCRYFGPCFSECLVITFVRESIRLSFLTYLRDHSLFFSTIVA